MPFNIKPEKIGFNPRENGAFQLPFPEQIDFFRQKLNLPTEHYDDIIKSAHDRAFVVAGAAKADLLNDLRKAVDRSIAEGKSIGWFRQEFDKIVAKHGWTGWTGEGTDAGRDWRTRVIYRTNLSASYAAGRYAQLTNPALLKSRPYWKYIHNDTVQHPRPLHQSWNGLVLRYDDPFWQSHFPPNGWGCRCRITAVRADQYKGDRAPDDGTYEFVDRHGEVHRMPQGVDYGWDYAPGASRSTPLIDIVNKKLIDLSAPIGANMAREIAPVIAMERQLSWTDTLTEWLSTPQSGRVAVIGSISPSILDWLAIEKLASPGTAEISIREGLIRGTKQARHDKQGDGLNEEEWRRLPGIIDDPDQILFDVQTGKLIYIVSSADAGIKVAVEFDYSKKGQKTNMLVSAFRQSERIIADRIKGGLYRVIKK